MLQDKETIYPMPQGKLQPQQLVYSDLHLLNCWHKFEWIYLSRSLPRRWIGYSREL